MEQESQSIKWRKTAQNLPQQALLSDSETTYRLYPLHQTPPGKIQSGFHALAGHIRQHSTVVIDGYVGVMWHDFKARLAAELDEGIQWIDMSEYLLPESNINDLVAPFLGEDDPIFGTRTTLSLKDFFDADQLSTLQPAVNGKTIAYGCGASLLNWNNAYLVYLDMPRNEIQYRSRAGSIWNIGQTAPLPPKPTYKRFYFVDWVVLNQRKAEIIHEIDLIIDTQNPNHPTIMDGNDFRNMLEKLSTTVFRVRPWFEPGAWGGQWMKANLAGLPQEVKNYAWSFEMIAPEQGILFSSENNLLEASFDFLMYYNPHHILGDYVKNFGYEFPIRFDFLDTIEGGNLSIQCHPEPHFIREQFGEHFTQDETYYIMERDDSAVVYLGFQDGVEPDAFRAALEESHENSLELNITDYVQKFTANKGDLFLIPHGTIHASGSGSLVLEISATPYIFTFKMYDWLRLDLDGKPRPINIERAFQNLNFDRQGDVVPQTLISKPQQIYAGNNCKIEHLPTHPDHFYGVQRYQLFSSIDIETNGSVQVLMVVEGETVKVEVNNEVYRYNYAETFIVPAAAKNYRLINPSDQAVTIVRAFMKSEWFEKDENQWLSLH